MTRALLINDGARLRISHLIEKASRHITPLEVVRAGGERRAAGGPETEDANSAFTIMIPRGYWVTYTQEKQREDCVCAHISISVADAKPGFGPNPAAVQVILEEFGFKHPLKNLPSWTSRTSDGELVVEFIEPLDGDLTRLRRPD
jgi:hypothetical protein